jgi:copper chaperone NosL
MDDDSVISLVLFGFLCSIYTPSVIASEEVIMKRLCGLWIGLLCFYACENSKVEPIQFGSDYCDECKMQITDRRYGGAALTHAGKTYKFDSVECLSDFVKNHRDEVKEKYYVDFQTSELKNVKETHLYLNEKMSGPMGTHLQSYQKLQPLKELQFDEISSE